MQQSRSTTDRWHVLLATWLGEFFDGLDASIYVLVMYPALSELLGNTAHSAVGAFGSYVMAAFMIGWAVGAIVFGILSDYIGRARTLVLTILTYALFTGICALVHSWQELALCRFLVGCGIGGEISIGAVMLSECWQGRARLHAVGAMCTSFAFGYLAAALLNLVLGHISWRWLFVAGIIPAVITVYIRAKLREPEQFDTVQAAKKRLRAKSPAELTNEERRLLQFTLPVIFNKHNWHKTLIVIALASTAIIGYWAVLSWIPAWVNQLTGHHAVNERSLVAIVMNLGGITAAALGGFVVALYGRRNAFRFTFLGALIACVGMFLSVKSFGVALLVWVFFVGAFATSPFIYLFIYVPELFDAQVRGTAFGFSVQLGRILAACAALAGGQMVAGFGGQYAVAGSWVAMVYAVGALASFFMPLTTGEVQLEAGALPAMAEPEPALAPFYSE